MTFLARTGGGRDLAHAKYQMVQQSGTALGYTFKGFNYDTQSGYFGALAQFGTSNPAPPVPSFYIFGVGVYTLLGIFDVGTSGYGLNVAGPSVLYRWNNYITSISVVSSYGSITATGLSSADYFNSGKTYNGQPITNISKPNGATLGFRSWPNGTSSLVTINTI